MSGPDRASSHEGGPFQATEPEEAEYTIPTAATFEKHAGQGRPDDLPSFPAAATAARPAARTAANVGRAGGIVRVAEGAVRGVVGEAEVDGLDVPGVAVRHGPVHGAEDVGRARAAASVAAR